MTNSVFVLTSDTYCTNVNAEPGFDSANAPSKLRVVGVFDTFAAAEWYMTKADPPVEDGQITAWNLDTMVAIQRDLYARCVGEIVEQVKAERTTLTLDGSPSRPMRPMGDNAWLSVTEIESILARYGWIEPNGGRVMNAYDPPPSGDDVEGRA